MGYLGIALVAVFILLVVAYVVWRFRTSGEMEAGGSLGRQLFGRGKDDWGPKP
jgi:hypothetical protein